MFRDLFYSAARFAQERQKKCSSFSWSMYSTYGVVLASLFVPVWVITLILSFSSFTFGFLLGALSVGITSFYFWDRQ